MLMLTLIFAGEIVFLLPFHTTRFFRPTMLEAFELTNTQLGDFFAVYGIMAMIAYFPGGALADRFSAFMPDNLDQLNNDERRDAFRWVIIGYTPEIFFGPITGRILDANPGPVGHQNYFLFLAIVATVGMVVVGWLLWLQRNQSATRWPGVDTTS